MRKNPEHLQMLEQWMKSYRPEELFDEDGRLRRELAELAPEGQRRMGANPHANGGLLLQGPADARLPRLRRRRAARPAAVDGRGHARAGRLPARRDEAATASSATSACSGPDETASNRSTRCFEVTDRAVDGARSIPDDDHLAPDGRVMEILSEHTCQGWLEGYLLTGRHGLFSCYEAFIHIVDSMFNQHAKWLKVTRQRSPGGGRSPR